MRLLVLRLRRSRIQLVHMVSNKRVANGIDIAKTMEIKAMKAAELRLEDMDDDLTEQDSFSEAGEVDTTPNWKAAVASKRTKAFDSTPLSSIIKHKLKLLHRNMLKNWIEIPHSTNTIVTPTTSASTTTTTTTIIAIAAAIAASREELDATLPLGEICIESQPIIKVDKDFNAPIYPSTISRIHDRSFVILAQTAQVCTTITLAIAIRATHIQLTINPYYYSWALCQVVYLYWRWSHFVAQKSVLILSIPFVLSETLHILFGSFITYFVIWNQVRRPTIRLADLCIPHESLPTVDIMIPCFNEPVEVSEEDQ